MIYYIDYNGKLNYDLTYHLVDFTQNQRELPCSHPLPLRRRGIFGDRKMEICYVITVLENPLKGHNDW